MRSRTLKTLEAEKRPATAEEKEILSKYVGWGALAKAFDKNDEKWAAEYKELLETADSAGVRSGSLNGQ